MDLVHSVLRSASTLLVHTFAPVIMAMSSAMISAPVCVSVFLSISQYTEECFNEGQKSVLQPYECFSHFHSILCWWYI